MKEITEILDNYFMYTDLKIESLHKDSPFILSMTSDTVFKSGHRKLILQRFQKTNNYQLVISINEEPSVFLKDNAKIIENLFKPDDDNTKTYNEWISKYVYSKQDPENLKICFFNIDNFTNVEIEYETINYKKTPVKIIFDKCFSIERRQ